MIKKSILPVCFFLIFFVSNAEPIRSEGYWEINGTTLHYVIIGEGEPILALHGGPGGNLTSKLDLVKFAPGNRWIFYDQRGSGESERYPVDLDSFDQMVDFFSIENHVRDMEEIRTLLGYEQVTILGHSWGGALAAFYAVAHPDRVKKLIIYSGGPVWPEIRMAKQKELIERADRKTNARVTKISTDIGNHVEEWDQAKLDKEFIKLISLRIPEYNCQPTAIPDVAELGRGGFWANHLTNRYIQKFDREVFAEKLKKINCPTLIINGRCDPSPIERQTYLHDNIPNSVMVVFDESGHNAHLEQPTLFGELLRAFLSDNTLPMANYNGKTDKNGE